MFSLKAPLISRIEAFCFWRERPRLEKALEYLLLGAIVWLSALIGVAYSEGKTRRQLDIQEWLVARELKKCVEELIRERERQETLPAPRMPMPRKNQAIVL